MQHHSFDGHRTSSCYDDSASPTTQVASLPRPAEEADDTRNAQADHWTPRNRSEVALYERERLFRTTFDHAPIGIAHVSHDGRWLRCNQRLCDLMGYSCGELARLSIQDLSYPDDLDAELNCVRRALAGELDAYELEKRHIRKDGSLIWTHLTVSLVRTPEGEPDYFIVTLQDITERKRLEADRVWLLEWEQSARREREATNAQLQALQALTDTALSHLTLDDLLDELLERVMGVMGVDNSGILLVEEDGQTLNLRSSRGLLMEHLNRVPGTLGQGLPGRIAASRAPVILDAPSAADYEEAPPIIREHIHSVAGVPLLVQDPVEDQLVTRLVGTLCVGSVAPRHFTEADVSLLQRVADRVALAIDRAHLYAAEQDARRRAEAALARARTSEARAAERAEQLHTILETMSDGVAVYDTAGHVQLENPAYRELYAVERAPFKFSALPLRERIRLLHVRDATTHAPLPFEDTPAGRALRGEVDRGLSADLRVRAFDGRELEVHNSAAPLRKPDGQIIGAVVMLRDMTERNRLAREREAARADELVAREASRRLEGFLAIAAHDLRAPLTSVIGYLDLAKRRTERLASAVREVCPDLNPSVEAVMKRLDDAGEGSERLTRLLTLLFDTAAIRAGKLELRRAPHDLAALVREQVAALRVAAPGRVIRMHVPPGGMPVPVEADADRIGQVVTNYVTNALKYSAPSRPVDVSVDLSAAQSTATHRGWARVAVHDEGVGISEAERTRVWDLFHRAPATTGQGRAEDGTQGGNLGLGLYICKAIVEAHSGQVGVDSTIGQGSTFWFTLPLAA